MAKVGDRWLQETEPTGSLLEAYDRWIQPSTGAIRMRNSLNTAWVFHGYVDEELGGAFSKAGGMVAGPILGASNLAPLASPDFSGTPSAGGLSMATMRALQTMEKRLMERMSSEVTGKFAKQTLRSEFARNITVEKKILSISSTVLHSTGFTIDLPMFDGNVPARADQVVTYFAAWNGIFTYDGANDAHDKGIWLAEVGEGTRTFKAYQLDDINRFAPMQGTTKDSSLAQILTFIMAIR